MVADKLFRPDHSNRVVSPTRGLPGNMWHRPQINVFATRFNQYQYQTPWLGQSMHTPVLGGSGSVCLPTGSHLGQSGGKVTGLPMQENHSDCSRVAQHALVLGSSDPV